MSSTLAGGAGSGTLGGVLVGGSAGGGGASLVRELPYTGATHLMLYVAIGLVLLVAGVLLTTLSRRHAPSATPTRSGPRHQRRRQLLAVGVH